MYLEAHAPEQLPHLASFAGRPVLLVADDITYSRAAIELQLDFCHASEYRFGLDWGCARVG